MPSSSPLSLMLRTACMTACMTAALMSLCGCERPTDSPTAAVASVATSDPQALMTLAVPGWTPTQNNVISPEKDSINGFLLVTPALLVPLGEDRVVLLVQGRPSDEQGNDMSGHASAGNLGAYWFARKEGRWVKTGEQPSVTQTGFSGDIGELRHVELGGGKTAVAILNGSCWQGQCGQWLSLYELDDHHAEDLLGESVLLHSDALGFSESCEELAKLEAGATRRIPLEAYSEVVGCFDVTGEWSINADKTAATPGDLVIRFSGTQTSVKRVDKPKPPASKKASGDASQDEDNEEYLATVQAVDNVLTYRYEKGRYVKASGENPAPGI